MLRLIAVFLLLFSLIFLADFAPRQNVTFEKSGKISEKDTQAPGQAQDRFVAPKVKQVEGPEGHVSVAIDETSLNDDILTSFSTLAHWYFDPEANTPPPPDIARLHQQKISVAGFMFPLTEGSEVEAFCLMATTQTCCYGPRPQYNQFILVEAKPKVPFERLRPVKVTGTFFVEPKYQDGYIYRMEADKVTPAEDNEDATATVAATAQLFPWSILEMQRPVKPVQSFQELLAEIKLTPELTDMADKETLVKGFLITSGTNIMGETLLMVGCYSWDGCCVGTPPDLFNSVTIKTNSGSTPPQFWIREVAYQGKLVINATDTWDDRGLVTLEEAKPTKLNP